ncbi:MAG TPA: roadblock/LC7 domain-containing protein [Longimicrobiales bacterium]|nr:roadblock/LC7 domain-containing protein [Longimicrobiales bacterium]
MKREDLQRVAGALEDPMRQFVRESRVRTAILVNRSGQILAHHGFSRGLDVTNVAALSAAAHASAHALAQITGAGHWMHLHHAGQEQQLFLAPFALRGGDELVMVAIFDQDSTLGLVQLFFDRLTEAILAMPELGGKLPTGDVNAFEDDLGAGVERALSENREER